MKAKAQYKAALKIKSRLQGKAALSQEEKEKLAWAEKRIDKRNAESRKHTHDGVDGRTCEQGGGAACHQKATLSENADPRRQALRHPK